MTKILGVEKMQITVVTVCLNCEKVIEHTIKSVLSQNYNDFEYLILDGKSSDKTVEIAKKCTSKYNNVRIYSEKDNGVYDAMNKAAKISNGKYIYYLNAGDYFYNDTVLTDVANYLQSNRDIYYGMVNKDGIIEKYPSNLNLKYLVFREKMICHQALFVKKDILIEYPFDTSFKICADRDWLVRLKKIKKTSKYMSDLIIANYDCNGLSSVYKNFQRESIIIAQKYGGIFAIYFVKIKRFFGSFIKRFKNY